MGKKIVKWEPEDFELEMTTHWSLSLIHISEPTRQDRPSRMPSSA